MKGASFTKAPESQDKHQNQYFQLQTGILSVCGWAITRTDNYQSWTHGVYFINKPSHQGLKFQTLKFQFMASMVWNLVSCQMKQLKCIIPINYRNSIALCTKVQNLKPFHSFGFWHSIMSMLRCVELVTDWKLKEKKQNNEILSMLSGIEFQ